jgi:hypothetical protein
LWDRWTGRRARALAGIDGAPRAEGRPDGTPAAAAATNPYAGLPDHAFWRRAVAQADRIDPVVEAPFAIGPREHIATLGSCFAQHLSRELAARGYRSLVTEPDPAAQGHPPFPARVGNIYTARQLLQLFDRAYGLFHPGEAAWRLGEAWVDPFRPRVASFPSEAALARDRKRHLACVRTMFETADVLVFTLGLTESWMSAADGAVYPLAPGVHGGAAGPDHLFRNMTADEIARDLREFRRKLKVVNPDARLILTVSPVPLIATYADRHVLVSNTYSKAALRVAAETLCGEDPEVAYFPSYEMVVQGRHFAEDQRSVTEAGVAQVMDVFCAHYLGAAPSARARAQAPAAPSAHEARAFAAQAQVVCDEDAIDPA